MLLRGLYSPQAWSQSKFYWTVLGWSLCSSWQLEPLRVLYLFWRREDTHPNLSVLSALLPCCWKERKHGEKTHQQKTQQEENKRIVTSKR
mmetsp:Transcript_31858/g.68796  ORF Transcript_31858/g.68796 Transcript_31858/m.68796 type:complete len:90 (+) Transcript_31858:278-547(+)